MTESEFLALNDTVAGKKVNRANALSLWKGLEAFGNPTLMQPHVLAQFLAQVSHESLDFTYDREVWNPKQVPAQGRYDTRTDLGNTPAADGDGFDNRGMGPIQLTGGGNRRAFRSWAQGLGMNPPDFVRTEALLTDPWEGLSAVWYWEAGNPTGKSLSAYADEGNIEAITRKVNGGLNGYEDRCRRYTRCALVMLGYAVGSPGSALEKSAIRLFQREWGLDADGIAGQDTRKQLHKALQTIPSTPKAPSPSFKVPAGTYTATVDALGNVTLKPI